MVCLFYCLTEDIRQPLLLFLAIQLYLIKQETSPDIVSVQILKANYPEKKKSKQTRNHFIKPVVKW